ncbi:metal-dependent hydrolase family protein [Georgenia alba]|uniref:Amidohydrolase family protein n=1 Tax=Georgenia alba TaxID=2233858 RepID=A0ABW2Q563_9MICO
MTLSIVNALVFDGWSEDLTEGSILLRDGEIAAVGDVTPEGEVLDARGAVVVPGLIDAHFHAYAHSLDGLEIERGPLSYAALVGARRLRDALRRGFTTVRDVAGGDIGLAQAIERGVVTAPHYLYSGPALSQTGGHGDPRRAEVDLCFAHGHINEIVDGVDAVRRAVRDRLRTGAHCIKIMASGGVFSLSDPLAVPQYSPEEVRTAVEEATRRGSYVAAHAYSSDAVTHAVTNGVRSVEHGNLIDGATARLMAEHDAFLVPTLAAYDAMDRRGAELGLNAISLAKNLEVLDHGKRAVELAYDAGVAVGFGSDLMGGLDDDQLVGVRLQMEASSPLATLRAMTRVNADLIGDARRGRIEPGAVGDVVVLDGNPFENPAVLWDETIPRTVTRAGHVVRD